MRLISGFFALAIALLASAPALAFCGFYVAQADADLYNQASQVIIARDGDRTVLTMANDYQGEVKDFALVVPVPVVLAEEQVHVGEPSIIKRLDSFSAPRLVEYFDDNPCNPTVRPFAIPQASRATSADLAEAAGESSLGVTVEAEFSVGEYDIVILSATESRGLETWLRQNNYRIPRGASELLQPYIRENLKFFVAKVNLEEFEAGGFQSLRPLMMAFESPRFMLPIRLGMANAQGEQDLIVYLLSPQGQVELTNYRTVKVPSNVEIPEYIKEEQLFGDFYKATFETDYQRQGKNAAFLEYSWNMAWCDPCSAPPLNREELKQAGVFWLDSNRGNDIFITRLHVRYTRDMFPEDLRFQETSNSQTFQGRYVIRHPYRGEANCSAASEYYRRVRDRQLQEMQTLAKLTGWDLTQIRDRVDLVEAPDSDRPWWRNLWGN